MSRALLNYVSSILDEIEREGDIALLKYARKFDQFQGTNFEISSAKKQACMLQLDDGFKQDLDVISKRIRLYAQYQRQSFNEFEFQNGCVKLGQKILPLDSVGCYIPGGRYPLISTALMTIIPAQVAQVSEIIVCSPRISDILIGICHYLGATRVFNIGGIQAIGGMTYSNNSIPQVAKIVGPGNKYITMAKKIVFGKVGIDFVAGPSEVLVIADQTAIPDFIAADLLAQAEHDPEAMPLFISVGKNLIPEVLQSLADLQTTQSTQEISQQSLDPSKFRYVETAKEAIQLANEMAPEHLELAVHEPNDYIPFLNNYGTLFIGNFSAETFGDYVAGTNHVLPTAHAARYTGGLHVKDFFKIVSYQEVLRDEDPKSFNQIVGLTQKFAQLEGLIGHKLAASIREKFSTE